MRTGFDSTIREQLQISWSRRIMTTINVFIPKTRKFSQLESEFQQVVISYQKTKYRISGF